MLHAHSADTSSLLKNAFKQSSASHAIQSILCTDTSLVTHHTGASLVPPSAHHFQCFSIANICILYTHHTCMPLGSTHACHVCPQPPKPTASTEPMHTHTLPSASEGQPLFMVMAKVAKISGVASARRPRLPLLQPASTSPLVTQQCCDVLFIKASRAHS